MPAFSKPTLRLPRSIAPVIVLLCLSGSLLQWAGSASAQTAHPSARRLQITIDSQRQAGIQLGADRGRGLLAQQVVLSALLHSDGVLSPSNPLDPEDGRRQWERAQRQQQRVQTALNRQGGGRSTAAAAADLQSMQARAQQMQARCGTDRECLLREASALSAAQVARGDAGTQTRLQAYGAAVQACERGRAAARDACVSSARSQAGGSDDESDRDDTVETPYLLFSGRAACQLEVAIKIDDRIEGQFQDVQGTVPFTQTTQAERRKRDDTSCPLVQAVLDTRNGRVWTNFVFTMGEVPGVMVRSEKGRAPQRHEGMAQLQWHEAGDWLNQRLAKLDAGGEDQVKLPAGAGGRNDGQVEVKLRWRFAPA